MPTVPVDHPLNLTTQAVLTAGGYAIWAGFVVYAALIGIRQRAPVYLFIIFAAGFGGLFEALKRERRWPGARTAVHSRRHR